MKTKVAILEKKVVLIDNFDSFTHNLKHYIEQFIPVDVIRVDRVEIEALREYHGIVFSPGPKLPKDYPILKEILTKYMSLKPILGVCLGMQLIGEFYGGNLINLKDVKHGVSEELTQVSESSYLFSELTKPILVARYHSWLVEATEELKKNFFLTAFSEDHLMAIEHKHLPICGMQFHPESIMTPQGLQMINNWVKQVQKHSLVATGVFKE